MRTSEEAPRMSGTPGWLWIAAGLGIVWNVYGVYQFTGSLSKTAEDSICARE